MTLETFAICFAGIISTCWSFLEQPIILGTYSLFNVFQGVFACWAFKIVIIDGVLNLKQTGISNKPKNKDFYYDSKGNYKKYKE